MKAALWLWLGFLFGISWTDFCLINGWQWFYNPRMMIIRSIFAAVIAYGIWVTSRVK